MSKTADNSRTSITCHFPPLASTGGNDVGALENYPTQSLAESRDGKTDNAELIRELTRAKVALLAIERGEHRKQEKAG